MQFGLTEREGFMFHFPGLTEKIQVSSLKQPCTRGGIRGVTCQKDGS
jgi:hypothetical protein